MSLNHERRPFENSSVDKLTSIMELLEFMPMGIVSSGSKDAELRRELIEEVSAEIRYRLFVEIYEERESGGAAANETRENA